MAGSSRLAMLAAGSVAAASVCGLRTHALAEHHPAHLMAKAAPPACIERLDGAQARLLQVQVVFRHGARTPLTSKSYLWGDTQWDCCGSAFKAVELQLQGVDGKPVTPSASDSRQRAIEYPGGCAKGELTLVGQRQAHDLGSWLRRRYVEDASFLPASYQEGLVAARTTNFSRTKATLAGVLTGLFPDTQAPIRGTTSSDLDEILYADTRTCPHLGALMEAAAGMVAAQGAADAAGRSGLQARLVDVLGLPADYFASSKWTFTDLHDALTSMAAHGKPLPGGLHPSDPLIEEVNRLATREFAAFVSPSLADEHGHEVLRLSMGRLLDVVLGNMEAALEEEAQQQAGAGQAAASSSSSGGSAPAAAPGGQQQRPRLYLYSGHDSSIMPLLVALGADVSSWPPYASNIVFELWQLHGDASSVAAAGAAGGAAGPGPRYAVRVLFNQQPLPLPGCGCGSEGVGYDFWRDAILRPFALSHSDHAEACAVRLSHEGALPQPKGFDLSAPQQQQAEGGK